MIPAVIMSRTEAEEAVGQIRSGIEGIGTKLLDLYNREGWKALEYPSWRECVRAEFGWEKSHAYRQLQAARINLELSPIGETGSPPANEAQARELARIPDPVQRAEVWTAVREERGERVTAADIRRAVTGPEPETDVNGMLPIIDLETGEIVGSRPRRLEPSSGAVIPEPTPFSSPPVVLDIPEITPEERLWDQLIRISTVDRFDTGAVAETAIRRRGISSAEMFVTNMDSALPWLIALVTELRSRSASPIHRIK